MEGEFYFMALGGLGVSLAGFAGLIAALDRRPAAPSAVAAWRIRNIVLGGFVVTFAGFGTVALYALTQQDLALTVRLASALLIVANLALLRTESRAGPAWPSERGRRLAIAGTLVRVAALFATLLIAGIGLLQLMLLAQLLDPISIFVTTVRDVARGSAPG